MNVGCTRVSIAQHFLTVQLDALKALGIDVNHTHVDHGLTGSGRARPKLEEALADVRGGQQ